MIRSERPGWRGFVKFLFPGAGLPVYRGAKPDSLTTPHFAEKKSFTKNQVSRESRSFQPDFQAHGTRSGGRFACGNPDSGRNGNRR